MNEKDIIEILDKCHTILYEVDRYYYTDEKLLSSIKDAIIKLQSKESEVLEPLIKLAANQKDLEPEYQKAIDQMFDELPSVKNNTHSTEEGFDKIAKHMDVQEYLESKKIEDRLIYGKDSKGRKTVRTLTKLIRDFKPNQIDIPRGQQLDLLDKYNQFLLKNGYTDTDIISEEPTAIDQFISEQNEHINRR